MPRDHSEQPKKEAPLYVEREVNLSLINQKLNEVVNLLYKIAEANKVDLDEE